MFYRHGAWFYPWQVSTTVADEVSSPIAAGLENDDPLVRLMAHELALSQERIVALETANARLAGERDRLAEQLKRLRGRLEDARRAGKRQSAPFSKGTKKSDPKRPGRKAGAAYGAKARRRPPDPADVDEVVDVPPPDCCPGCGGDVEVQEVVPQWQEEIIPAHTRMRRYDIALGRCTGCKRRVRGRHRDQTSDATGAAGVMLGPLALALAAWLKVGLGVPMAKVAQILQRLGGLDVTPGGLYQALHGIAGDAQSTYQALIAALRASQAVAADETGWRINGDKAWLWVYVGEQVTVFDIAEGRGFAQSSRILDAGYAGTLERDGWSAYGGYTDASHQTCLAHLLRRTHEMISDSIAGQARIPHQLRRILLDALLVRERNLQGQQLAEAITKLTGRIDAFCASQPTHEPNRKLVRHVTREREHLLTFLTTPGVQATNWRAEEAIRPMVVNRKSWGGNKTRHGADTTATIASILRTATQQDLDPIAILDHIQRTGRPPPDLRLVGPPP